MKPLSRVVILAGGFGTRLRAVLGDEIPKPMAEIDGMPLIEHQIKLCKACGFEDILILLHHLPGAIKGYLGDGQWLGVRITYATEESPRGTAGAIRDVLHLLAPTFLVLYGDTFIDVDLKHFFDAKSNDVAVLTFAHPNSHPEDSDLLSIDEDGFVKDVFRPSKVGVSEYRNIVNAALYAVDSIIFEKYADEDAMTDIASNTFPRALAGGEKISAYQSVEYIKDMGTPDRLESVRAAVSRDIPARLSRRFKRKAVFLDRDGVLNRHKGYITKASDFHLLPNVTEAVKLLNKNGILAICITNQPVIARGDISISELDKIHMKLEVELGKQGAYLDAIYYCPHHPDGGFDGEVADLKISCECRKPLPGMISRAAEEFNVNLESSWIVGDTWRDIQAGKAAGIKTAYVGKPDSSISANYWGKDLLHSVEHIFQIQGW